MVTEVVQMHYTTQRDNIKSVQTKKKGHQLSRSLTIERREGTGPMNGEAGKYGE